MFIKQGSAVMRIVSFAVAIAIVLGLASVMFQVTAGAEAVSNVNALDLSAHQIGALGNYPVIGLPTSQLLADYIATADSNSTNGIVDYFVPFTVYNGVVYYSDNLASITYRCSYFDKLPICFINLGGQIVLTNIYDSIKAGSDTPTKSTDYRYLEISAVRNVVTAHYTTYPNDFYKCTYAFKSSKGDILSDTNVSNIMYARVTTQPYGVSVSNSSSYIKDTDSFADMESLNLPSAEFLTFKGTDEAPQPLFFMDWVNAGKQYPIVDFRIDDNGNHHQYALRISNNSKYVDVAKEMWDNQELKESISAVSNAIGIALLGKAIHSGGSKFVLGLCSGVSQPIGMLFFNVPTNSSQVIHASLQAYIIKSYSDFSYDLVRNLTSDKLTFTEDSDVVSKAVSICLSDYVSVVPYNFYKLEIIDTTNSMILSTAYFNSARGYVKSDSGYGTKVTDYDNRNNLDNDVNDDNGYINGDNNDGDKMDSDNPEDIINRDYNDSLANLDITNLIGSLRTAIASASLFFQACWSLFPAAFWSIILIGISLIIILRILGR